MTRADFVKLVRAALVIIERDFEEDEEVDFDEWCTTLVESATTAGEAAGLMEPSDGESDDDDV